MFKTLLLSAAATIALFSGAQAQTIAALTGPDTLVHIDAAGAKITKQVKITGASPILGIDVRPADGMLYALGNDGTVFTIDPISGKATLKVKLETSLPKDVTATVDFNPAADRLRIIGSDGTNLRANVDDGKVAVDKPLNFAEADANKGKKPMIVAGAYSNSVKGTKETALYDIDASGIYTRQAPPNDGILNTLGGTGLSTNRIAFDILADGNGGNTGWLVADGMLYKLDIANGKLSEKRAIGGANGLAKRISDIAVLGM